MKRRTVALLLALCTVLTGLALCIPAVAGLEPGDSLITKSYLEKTLTPKLENVISARVTADMNGDNPLVKKLQTTYDAFAARLTAAKLASNMADAAYRAVTARGSVRTLNTASRVTLRKGDVLTGKLGATVSLLSGSAKTGGSGMLINVSTGTETASGTALVVNNLYIQSEKTGSTVTANADNTVLAVTGSYTVKKANAYVQENVDMAFALRQMHLLSGTEDGFKLTSPLTRGEGLVVMINFLGKASEASKTTGEMPFTDVPGWLRPFAAYAWQHKLIAGTSTTAYIFKPNDPITSYDMVTMLLRCMGYSDAGGKDFVWNQAVEKAVSLGIFSPKELTYLKSGTFVRDKMVYAAYYMLDGKTTGGKTMYDQLIAQGTFTAAEGSRARKNVSRTR